MKHFLRKSSELIFLGLLIYMPVHVLISTWVGSSLGLLTVTKILKDVVLVVGLVMAFLAVDKSTLRKLARDKLAWLIVAYTALTLVMALIRSVEQDAEVLGIVYNLRFLAMFVYATLIISWAGAGFRKRAVRIVVCAGLIVAAFGVIQYTLLPSNALSHLGYSKVNGTPPAFFIDEKPDLERVMSTLKDPNSLGSYLLIIVFFNSYSFQKSAQTAGLRWDYFAMSMANFFTRGSTWADRCDCNVLHNKK
jgi:hypothetical protein